MFQIILVYFFTISLFVASKRLDFYNDRGLTLKISPAVAAEGHQNDRPPISGSHVVKSGRGAPSYVFTSFKTSSCNSYRYRLVSRCNLLRNIKEKLLFTRVISFPVRRRRTL